MPKNTAKPQSPVIHLLDHVWKHCNDGTSHSWERLNHAMSNALSLAIGAGFAFDVGDVKHIMTNYSSGHWIGESDEWIYADAIRVANMSAVQSYEAYKNRQPFIADDVRFSMNGSSYMHGGGDRKKERLAVGFEFKHQGKKFRVTSFADDSSYVTACSYKRLKVKGFQGQDYWDEKFDKRIQITREGIKLNRAEMANRKKYIERLNQAVLDAIARKIDLKPKISKALKASGCTDIDAVPIQILKTVADQFAPLPPPPPKGTTVTKEIRMAAMKAGACRGALRPYPIGSPLSKISIMDWEWAERHLPELVEKHKHARGAANAAGDEHRAVQVSA